MLTLEQLEALKKETIAQLDALLQQAGELYHQREALLQQALKVDGEIEGYKKAIALAKQAEGIELNDSKPS